MNLSFVSNAETARTNKEAAFTRAENLAMLGASNVLELCVGPSLETLEDAYNSYVINVTGNDIEPRWKNYYTKGKWVIGDALNVDYSNYDSIVFAPPLSVGCTGTRKDSLSIDGVTPSYYKFLFGILIKKYPGNIVLVLPARCLSTRKDRQQLYRLLSFISKNNLTSELVELKCGRRKIRKYVDLYLRIKL
ncbi:hypothetical protein LCGC14_0478510 [marine sediment metagenome]|uniref:Uncharacterized protein n=1 Tax=marine sediment metagenome TaxID=412755 RepID=A0A0F9SSZ2_9ZZZZ